MKPVNFNDISDNNKNYDYRKLVLILPIILLLTFILFDNKNLDDEISVLENKTLYTKEDVTILSQENSKLKEEYQYLEKYNLFYKELDNNKENERELNLLIYSLMENSSENTFIKDARFKDLKISIDGISNSQENISLFMENLYESENLQLEINEIEFINGYYTFNIFGEILWGI